MTLTYTCKIVLASTTYLSSRQVHSEDAPFFTPSDMQEGITVTWTPSDMQEGISVAWTLHSPRCVTNIMRIL